MGSKNSVQPLSLESAFQTFNDLSEQLADSYKVLEGRVACLSEELNETRGERLEELAEKERLANRLTQLLELLPGGVVVLDKDGVITETNPAASELLGEPLICETWRSVITRAFAPEIDDGSEVNLRNGKRVSITSSSLGNEPGKIVLINDVTEQHALQSMLNRHYRLSAMGEMAASLAHQIRTPLATALLYISHLNRPELSDEERLKTHDKVISRLRYLDHMVNDMLQFAKSGSFEMESIQINQLIDNLIQSIEPQLSSYQARLNIKNIGTGLQAKGNHDALLGALINIVINAFQVKRSDAIVTIEVKKNKKQNIEFIISDNGPGISEGDIKNIFTPFYTNRPDGTGLGLAVVQAIVEAHNGTVNVVSKNQSGAVFIIEVAAVQEEEMIKQAVRKGFKDKDIQVQSTETAPIRNM